MNEARLSTEGIAVQIIPDMLEILLYSAVVIYDTFPVKKRNKQ
jgi:hypothetical protein